MKKVTIDKSAYPSGPWMDESDFLEGTDDATGYAVCIRRNYSGCLCGYVGIPITHPWGDSGYEELAIDVHGGLTYAGTEGAIAWFGFDCAHVGDLIPVFVGMWDDEDATYRDIDYVKAEVKSLAAQLKLGE